MYNKTKIKSESIDFDRGTHSQNFRRTSRSKAAGRRAASSAVGLGCLVPASQNGGVEIYVADKLGIELDLYWMIYGSKNRS